MRLNLIRNLNIFTILTLILGAFNNSCSPAHDPSTNTLLSLTGSQNSIDIFQNTLHPVLVQNCGQCHGSSQAPQFAVSNVDAAHLTVISGGLVNLTSPRDSRLVQKIIAGHQGKSQAVATEIQTQITNWADQLKASGGEAPAPPQLTATFSSINALVLGPKCTTCHGGTQRAAGYSYASYSDTLRSVNVTSPNQSLLYTIIASGEMPPAGSPDVTNEELAVILAWITAGAQNN